MGGVLVIGAVVVSSLLWARLDNQFVWLALFSMVYLGGLGFADDYLKVTKKKSEGITAGLSSLFQIILAAIVTGMFLTDPLIEVQARSLYVPFIKTPVIANMSWFTFVFFALVIVGTSNAVNLTDGLDGLAIGCTITVAFAYALLCLRGRQFPHRGIPPGPVLSVRRRTDRCLRGAYRRRAGLSLVQLSSGQSFHGRHRIARDRRHDRCRRDLL